MQTPAGIRPDQPGVFADQVERWATKPASPGGSICFPNVTRLRPLPPVIRDHWQIENSLHWSLDVAMNEGQHRARKDHTPANFAALRRIALNIIRANPAKGSNRGKFKKADWSNDFLKTLMQGF